MQWNRHVDKLFCSWFALALPNSYNKMWIGSLDMHLVYFLILLLLLAQERLLESGDNELAPVGSMNVIVLYSEYI